MCDVLRLKDLQFLLEFAMVAKGLANGWMWALQTQCETLLTIIASSNYPRRDLHLEAARQLACDLSDITSRKYSWENPLF